MNWQDNKLGVTPTQYYRIHHWLRNTFGSANKCENQYCKKRSKNYEWALRDGYKYQKIKKNFQMLCIPCHRELDSPDFNIYGGNGTKRKWRLMRKNGLWAVGYDKCRLCKTIKQKHHVHGYCKGCYYKAKKFNYELQSELRKMEEVNEI